MNSIRRYLYLACALALASCGLKGPLYLPDQSGAQHAPNASRAEPTKTQPSLPDPSQPNPGATVSNPSTQSQSSRR